MSSFFIPIVWWTHRLPVFTPILGNHGIWDNSRLCRAASQGFYTMLWREFSSPHGAGGIFTGLHNQNPRAFVDVSSEQNLCSWIIIRLMFMDFSINLPGLFILIRDYETSHDFWRAYQPVFPQLVAKIPRLNKVVSSSIMGTCKYNIYIHNMGFYTIIYHDILLYITWQGYIPLYIYGGFPKNRVTPVLIH